MSEEADVARSPKLPHELAIKMHRSGHSWIWALVDPIVSNQLKTQMEAREMVQIPIRYADLPSGKRPFLVRVGEPGRDNLMDDLLRLSKEEALRRPPKLGGPKVRSVCGYLVINGEPTSLAQRLARAAVFRWQGRQRLLRFWDPRVMDLFAHLLDEEQKSDLFASVSEWWWLGRDGSIRFLPRRDDASSVRKPLSLRAEQIDYLRMSEAINGTLDVLQDMGIKLGDACDPKRIGLLVERGVRQWQLVSTADRVTYALHALLVGPGFDTIQPVRDAMKQEWERSGAAMRALDRYSDEDWERMKSQSGAKAPDIADTRKESHG